MQNDIKTIVGGVIFIIIFGVFSNVIVKSSDGRDERVVIGSWACADEVQICPNGSTVTRTPPYCQFAACSN